MSFQGEIEMKHYAKIGEVIKYLRNKSHLSQAELSKDICSCKQLGRIERNESSPSIELINLLSNRIGVNIYDTYALILEHHDIETHQQIVEINELIHQRDFVKLHHLVTKLEKYPSFSSGVPFKYIKYSESLYFSQQLHNYETAIQVALEGLESDGSSFLSKNPSSISLSSADLLLAQCIAVNLCRIDQYDLGKQYFNFIFDYLYKTLSADRYVVNRNMRFELNFLSHTAFNKYTFFHEHSDAEYANIVGLINLLNSHDISAMLPELLFCKAQIEFDNGNDQLAEKTLSTARTFALFFYDPERANAIEKEIRDLD